MVDDVSRAIGEAAKKAAVLLYSPEADPFFEDPVKNADRIWYFDEGPRATTRLVSKAYPKAQKREYPAGVLMRWPWRCKGKIIEPLEVITPSVHCL